MWCNVSAASLVCLWAAISLLRNRICAFLHIYSSGSRHGRTGQSPGAAFLHVTWGAARAVKKNTLCREVFLFFIISIQLFAMAPCFLIRCRAQKRCQGNLLISSRIASFARSRSLFQILYVSNRRTGSAHYALTGSALINFSVWECTCTQTLGCFFLFSVNKSFSKATASVFLWWKYISY